MPKELPPNQNPFFVILGLVTTVIFIKIIPVIIRRLTNRVRSEHRIQYNILNGLRTDFQTLQQIVNTIDLRIGNAIANVNTRGNFYPLPFVNQELINDLNFVREQNNRLLIRLNNQYRAVDNMLQLLREGNSHSLQEINNLIDETQRVREEIETLINNAGEQQERLINIFLDHVER